VVIELTEEFLTFKNLLHLCTMTRSVAFIFDMDGVIVDSNPFHKTSLKQFTKKYGYDLSESQLKEKIYGRTNKDWLANVFGNIDEKQLKQYADEKETLFRDLYKDDIKPLPGLINFLKLLDRDDFARAIATSAPKANVEFTLSKTNTGRFFQTILDESFVTKGKPHPEIYLKTAAALKFMPDRCIVFEDSLSGVLAGKKANCKVVGITTTHTKEELFEADFCIDNFVGLDPQSLIDRLF
jgi:HAD superfamily hydrolase (TIGR01509 family)